MGVCIRFVYVENAQEGGSPFFGIAQGVGTARVRGDLAEHVAKFMVAHDSAVKRIQQLSAKIEEIEETMAPLADYVKKCMAAISKIVVKLEEIEGIIVPLRAACAQHALLSVQQMDRIQSMVDAYEEKIEQLTKQLTKQLTPPLAQGLPGSDCVLSVVCVCSANLSSIWITNT